MKVYFRADATPEIGAGHISRCLTLARVLRRRGHDCVFAVDPRSLETVPTLNASGFPIQVVDDTSSSTFIEGSEADLLVVDHYDLNVSFERRCRDHSGSILVIDDLANREHDCDFLLDVTPGRTREAYASLVPSDAVLLLGPRYALLRPEFAMYRGAALHRRRSLRSVGSIVISLGMTDPSDATSLAWQAIAESPGQTDTTIVLGKAAPAFERIAAKSLSDGTTRLIEETRDMAGLLAAADLAIGAGGVSAFERCCLGLPTVMVCTAPNQQANAHALAALGAAAYAGEIEQFNAGSFAASVTELMSNPDGLRDMALSAARICDGRGSARVAATLAPPRTKDGSIVLLRPATDDDRQIMFDWQQHPETRQYARTVDMPSWDQHCDWFAKKIDDPNCLFNIILHDDEPAGVLRLDPTIPPGKRPAYEVSILVAPERKRLGVAALALNLAKEMIPEADLVAEILQDNKASLGLFLNAGYRPLTDTVYVTSESNDFGTPHESERHPDVLAGN